MRSVNKHFVLVQTHAQAGLVSALLADLDDCLAQVADKSSRKRLKQMIRRVQEKAADRGVGKWVTGEGVSDDGGAALRKAFSAGIDYATGQRSDHEAKLWYEAGVKAGFFTGHERDEAYQDGGAGDQGNLP